MNAFLKSILALFSLPSKQTPKQPAPELHPVPSAKPPVVVPAAPSKTIAVAKKPVTWIVIATTVVAAYEGFYPKKYYDSVGVATICYGATKADGVDLSKIYTKQQCLDMLGKDLPKYDAPLKKCLTPAAYAALPPHRHAALVSLAYNVGDGAVCKSAVVKYLNAGNVKAACDAFLAYNHAGGKVLQGLTNRRQSERKLCLMDD